MNLFRLLGLFFALFQVTGCDSKQAPSQNGREEKIGISVPEAPNLVAHPSEKPVPPLKLDVPTAMPEQLDGKNLTKMNEGELLTRANLAMGKEDYTKAAAYQYWYVQKSKTGQYNLACFLAQIGKTDAAFYWLQLAAIEEGVDTAHAERDEDLVSLRRDSRWGKVRQYLGDCNRYFESAPTSRTVVILPKGYQNSKPITAVVWLHGLGSRPEDFANDGCREHADALNVAIIGVSGTKARGPRSFVWAENVEQDGKRLRDALEEASAQVTIKKGQIITFGFSQGAQVGLEVAARYPEEYAGAIVLSPGARSNLNSIKPSSLLSMRGFVLCCGAEEHPGNVMLTANDADWLRRAKAKIIHKPYPGVSAHSFPADFDERFPEWIKFILKAQGE